MSSNSGNAGEYLVMAELLHNGFDAYLANRGNPAFDVACWWTPTTRATRLRIKTTSNRSAIWSAKKTGDVFLDLQQEDDYVVVCDVKDGPRGAMFYVIPTAVVDCELKQKHAFYLESNSSTGIPRKDSKTRVLRFYGAEKPTNRAYGYDQKWAKYLDAWDALK